MIPLTDAVERGGTIYTQLGRNVLAVLSHRHEGAWCVYVAGVPGNNHEAEWHDVYLHGDKLDPETARAIIANRFHPGIDPGEMPYAH